MNALKQFQLLLMVIVMMSSQAMAASFSAQFVTIRNGKTELGKFYLQDQRYRLEINEDGRTAIVIADRKTAQHTIIDRKAGTYFQISSNDFGVLANDPFKASEHVAGQYGIQDLGEDRVSGIACEKQLVQVQGTKVMTRWYSAELDFPLRVIMHQGKHDAIAELRSIRKMPLEANLFMTPDGLRQVEAPGAAAKRKRKEAAEKEAALAGLHGTGSAQVPCYVKISAGGELRVTLDTQRSAKVVVVNQLKQPSVVKVVPYREGRQVDNIGVSPWTLKGKGLSRDRQFNDDFARKTKSFMVDEVGIVVDQGLVYASVSQAGAGRTDFYNRGHLQNGAVTNPTMSLAVHITGDNPFGPQTTGRFLLKHKDAEKSQSVPFKVNTGETATWSYASDRNVEGVDVIIKQGDGRAKISLIQPASSATTLSQKAAPKPSVQKKAVSAAGAASVQAPSRRPAQSSATSSGSSPRMVLVLDASGSMWGQIEGTAKIAIAKTVMADLVAEIPARFHTGLTVYGHRRKGDCSDIEMVLPVGPHNARAMTTKVQGISPKGKTPLSAAVKQAADALRYTEERATVVLVSDGLETCDLDPCELAEELAMSGVDFTVHVVGFDISAEDQGRLRCLADKTGGLFLAADNAGSLRDALTRTVEKVKEPPPPVIEDPGVASLSGPKSIPAGAAFQVAWKGPDSQRDYITMAEKSSKDSRYVTYAYTQKGNPAEFVAPGDVGAYELRYVHAHTRKVIGRMDINVTPVTANVQTAASADVATEFTVDWIGPAYPSDYISISRPDQRPGSYVNYTYTHKGSPLKVRAPSEPGTYEVRYILGRGSKQLAKTTIEIKAVGASVQAAASADVATEFEVSWQGPGNKEDYISISRPDQRPGSYVGYTYTHKGSPLKVRAPSEPGTYEVRYILGRGSKQLAKTTIEIKAVTAQVQAPASADMAAEFEVSWQGPGNKEDYISISRPDQSPGSYVGYTYTHKGSPLNVRAPSEPGSYEVRYILGRGSKLLAKTIISIKPVTAQVTCSESTTVNSEIEVRWQGPGYKSDYICISRPDQGPGRYVTYRYTGRGNPAIIKTPKQAGTYEVRYILGRGGKILAKAALVVQ